MSFFTLDDIIFNCANNNLLKFFLSPDGLNLKNLCKSINQAKELASLASLSNKNQTIKWLLPQGLHTERDLLFLYPIFTLQTKFKLTKS